MGYKTKSMIKQLSGLSVDYYLEKERNRYTDKISQPIKEGESIAKSTKKFTPFEILKSKDSAKDRDEKKKIRRAGREAARNTDVDFVKATPMGSDYFSLMAATAENLASRGAGKRKARKAAKDLKRKILSEGRDVKTRELKVFKNMESNNPESSSSNTKIKIPKNPNKFKTLPTTPNDKSLIPKIKEKVNKSEPVKDYLTNYGPPTPPSSPADMNKSFGQQVYRDFEKMGEDARYFLTPEAGRKRDQIRRDLGTVGLSQNKYNEEVKKNRAFVEKTLGIGTNTSFNISKDDVAKFYAPIKKARDERMETIEAAKAQEMKEAEERLKKFGLNMMGDGFNKGMSRKNKYKK